MPKINNKGINNNPNENQLVINQRLIFPSHQPLNTNEVRTSNFRKSQQIKTYR